MNTKQWYLSLFYGLLALAWVALLAGCQPVTASTSQPTEPAAVTQPPADTPTIQVTATIAPATEPAPTTGEISLELSGLATGETVEQVAAVSADSGAPWWEILPAYQRITLQGYPASEHPIPPQFFAYPVDGLIASNPTAAQNVSELQSLLLNHQPGEQMPFLPLLNEQQALFAKVQYLDFKNGQGVRYLTQYNQGPVPVNNQALFYTFQGLSSDGRFYIAAVLPVTHPDLPATPALDPQSPVDPNDYPAYIQQMVNWLEEQPDGSFTPDLAALDAMIQSIEVK